MDFSTVKRYCQTIRSGDLGPGKMPRRQSVTRRYASKQYTTSDIVSKVFPTFRPIAIRPNDYPYDVTKDVQHHVMWFHPNKFDFVPDEGRVDEMLHHVYDPDLYDIAWFQNPKEWQSVPTVPHIHVFVRELERLDK